MQHLEALKDKPLAKHETGYLKKELNEDFLRQQF